MTAARGKVKRKTRGAKMSVCLIIASYHNYLLFDSGMYVIRVFPGAVDKM